MITEAAGTRKATVGTGAKRPPQQDARGGGSDTVAPQPRTPAALADLLVEPDAARARRPRDDTRDDAPRAQQGRRVARLGRTQPAVMEGSKADAARRAPPHRTPWGLLLEGARCLWRRAPQLVTPWKRVTGGLDLMPGVGSLWAAANAVWGEASTAGTHWGQQTLTEMRSGRVGDVSGGLRHILTTPRRRQSGRPTRAQGRTFVHNPRRWRPYDQSLAMGVPVGTGVVESAGGAVVTHRLAGEGQR